MNDTQVNEMFYIKEALKFAKKGMGWTNPNPMVGAVIVKNGKIIGKGYHRKVGLPHAEIEAINNAKTNVKGATLYVNLEPCIHYGRTPPCVGVIIKSGIKRVVCSILDPNPRVHGKGIELLKNAGIEVSVGILEKEARELNEAFFTFHKKERPFIAIKFAASLDGKIATKTGDSKWITNEQARKFARNLRSQYQAILVGINTILRDDSHLGVRLKGKKDPLRIILDSRLRILLGSQVLRDNNVLIVTTKMADKEKLETLHKKGVEVISVDSEKISLSNLLSELRQREIISLLIEGGGKTLGSFVDAKLVDKVYAFYAPIIIGGKEAIDSISGEGVKNIAEAIYLKSMSFKRFADNLLIIGYPFRGFNL